MEGDLKWTDLNARLIWVQLIERVLIGGCTWWREQGKLGSDFRAGV